MLFIFKGSIAKLFSATNRYRNFIRLNAANWSEEAERSVQRLGELIEELT